MGIDGGGVFKEFLNSFCRIGFKRNDLFIETDEHCLYPNNKLEYGLEYEFLGKIIGVYF